MLTCTNDRYCPTPDTFATVEEFQAMCLAWTGEPANLTHQPLNGRWVRRDRGNGARRERERVTALHEAAVNERTRLPRSI